MSTESNKSIEAHLAEIAAEAERIDPRTAKMVCLWVENHDPYGLGLDISPDEAQPVGRHPDLVDGRVTEYFLVDPEGDGPAVLVDAVRGLHPDIGDEEWGTLMSAAADRDDSPDPLYAHAYRRARPLKEPSKQELLDHYAEKPVTRLLQIDGFIDMVSDSFFEADSDGDRVTAGVSRELMSTPGGDMPVRLLIHEDAAIEDVRRLLAKMLDWLDDDRLFDLFARETARDLLAGIDPGEQRSSAPPDAF